VQNACCRVNKTKDKSIKIKVNKNSKRETI
jgi:hypothetical protein